MADPRLKNIFRFCEGCSYLTLVCLGAYIIQQGHVLQKYRLHRTNFAEYAENIAELPRFLHGYHPFTPASNLDKTLKFATVNPNQMQWGKESNHLGKMEHA